MFIPNPAFAKLYEKTQDARDSLAGSAEAAKERAEQLAPRRTGAYADSFEVRNEPEGVFLINTDFKANWIERGTVDTPVFAPMRRAAQSIGARFTEG